MAACIAGGTVLLTAGCAMTAAGGSGGKAKKAADSWCAREVGAALGETYTLQNTNCCCCLSSPPAPHDEYSSISQSMRTPSFLYLSFLSSPIWTPSSSLIPVVVCAAQDDEPGPAAARTPLLTTVKKKRSPVLGIGRNRRARSAGLQS
jgi:hypothetical protein